MYMCMYVRAYVSYTHMHAYCKKNTAMATSDCSGIWFCLWQCHIRQVVVVGSAAATRANYHTDPCKCVAARTGRGEARGVGVRSDWQSDSCGEKCQEEEKKTDGLTAASLLPSAVFTCCGRIRTLVTLLQHVRDHTLLILWCFSDQLQLLDFQPSNCDAIGASIATVSHDVPLDSNATGKADPSSSHHRGNVLYDKWSQDWMNSDVIMFSCWVGNDWWMIVNSAAPPLIPSGDCLIPEWNFPAITKVLKNCRNFRFFNHFIYMTPTPLHEEISTFVLSLPGSW